MKSKMLAHRKVIILLLATVLVELLYLAVSEYASDWGALWELTLSRSPHDPNGGLPLGTSAVARGRLSSATLELIAGVARPAAAQLASFYHRWKFSNALHYVLPCTAAQTLFGRLRRPISSLDELFPAGAGESYAAAEDAPLRTYDYDPRLVTAVYYDALSAEISAGTAVPAIAVPFSWYDWSDLSLLNGLIDLEQREKPECAFCVRKFFPADELLEYERKVGYRLFDQDRARGLASASYASSSDVAVKGPAVPIEDFCKEAKDNVFMPGFVSHDVLNFSRPEVYGLQAKTLLYATAPLPYSLTFLNRNGSSIQVRVANESPLRDGVPQHILFNGLLEQYLRRNVASYPKHPDHEIVFDNVAKFEELKRAAASAESGDSGDSGAEPAAMPYYLVLDPADFEFDAPAKIRELEAAEALSTHQQRYLESLRVSLNSHPVDLPKFFREASHVGDYVHMGHHFDARFFHGAPSKPAMRARLDAIVRAYLSFVHSNGLQSWISHGTMYGWLYDGIAFPWDGDHDVQMPIVHLNKLAELYNQTVVVEDPSVGNGRYFLDVTSSITSRIHGNGNNNIDARFIDVDSGLYIDITGLSVSSDGAHSRYNTLISEYERDRNKNGSSLYYLDPNRVEGVNDLTVDQLIQREKERGTLTKEREKQLKDYKDTVDRVQHDFKSKSPSDRYNYNKHIQVFNCRNNHFNVISELSPLRLTYFHGAKAYVPNQVIKLLRQEYALPPGYTYIKYSPREFLPEARVWLEESVVKKIAAGGPIQNGTAPKIDLDHMSKLTTSEFRDFLNNAATVIDPDVETAFTYLVNTFEISMFRKKELELIYDESLSDDEKVELLDELIRGRFFVGAYKDIFQNRLETNIWNNLLERTPSSYKDVLAELEKLHLKKARELLHLDELEAQNSYDWDRRAGYQHPPSGIDFNTKGRKFYTFGQEAKNEIFSHDPKGSEKLHASLTQRKD